MKKIATLFLAFICAGLWNQALADPYIVSSDGLGQYAYLETSATTYAKLNHGGFNVSELGARWWTGAEYIYKTGDFGGCAQYQGNTPDYAASNHANWSAGTIAYVSVRFKDCFFNWSSTNYNERNFMLIDVDNSYGGAFDNNVTDNPSGTDNLVGSFSIATGGNALTLDRLWLHNIGTALEGSDIPNGAIRIYYEALTGSETFDGNESYRTLYGDYSGNSGSNQEWGSNDLNLPMSASGVRCYVVVSDLATGFVTGHTAQFEIINDGISFQETRNGSYNLLRVNATTISPASIALPITLTTFDAKPSGKNVLLEWETSTERNNDRFDIQRSANGLSWTLLGAVSSQSTNSSYSLFYTFLDEKPLPDANYYRLRQVDLDGKTAYSKMVKVTMGGHLGMVRAFPNPLPDNTLWLEGEALEGNTSIRLYDPQGAILREWHLDIESIQAIPIDLSGIAPGLIFLQVNQAVPQAVIRQ